MKIILFLVLPLFLVSAFAEQHAWTFQNGDKFSGEYYSAGQEKVVVTIKLSDLSDTDKAYVATHRVETKTQTPANQLVRIFSVKDKFGLCMTSVGIVYMQELPDSVKDYLAAYYKLESAIPRDAANAENLYRAGLRANANALTGASGDSAYVDAAMAERKDANNMSVDAQLAFRDLAIETQKFSVMQTNLIQNTTVIAYPTGYSYNGFPKWQCVGIAPPAQPSN